MTAYCTDRPAHGMITSAPGQVEVDEATLTVHSYHNIRDADVAVDNPPIVQILYR